MVIGLILDLGSHSACCATTMLFNSGVATGLFARKIDDG